MAEIQSNQIISRLIKVNKITPGIPPTELIIRVYIFKGIFIPKNEKIRSQARSADMPEKAQRSICDSFNFFIIKIRIIIPEIINSPKSKLI